VLQRQEGQEGNDCCCMVGADADSELPSSRFTGRFVDPAVEAEYLEFHLKLWRPRLRTTLICSSVLYLALTCMAMRNKESFRSQILTLMPEKWAAIAGITIFARLLPGVLGVLIWLPVSRRILTPGSYQLVAMVGFFGPVLIDVAGLFALGRVESQIASRAVAHDFGSCRLTARVLARAAVWHTVAADFFASLVSGLSGIRPHLTAIFGALSMMASHMQLEMLLHWTTQIRWAGGCSVENQELQRGDGQLIPPYLRLLPVVAMCLITFSQDNALRGEFRLKKLLQHAKNMRIEQLQQEKERLGWERQLKATTERQAELRLRPCSSSASGSASAEIRSILLGRDNVE